MIPASAKPDSAWTSRRRLLTALSGGIPDRVPINTYELAGRNSRDRYNREPSYHGLMEYIRAHTDCITNWNPRPATDRYTCEERVLCSDFPVEIETTSETAGQFARTIQVCHTPKGDLRSVKQTAAEVYTTWQVEHWCKSLTDVDKALSVPYEPARYDASDLGRVRTTSAATLTRVAFNPENVKKLKPRSGHDKDVWWDTTPSSPPMFGLRVRRKGASVYVIGYRTRAGQQRTMRIAKAGDITLADARVAARSVLAEVAQGRDPLQERRDRDGAERLETLVKKYIDAGEAERSAKTTYTYRNALVKHIEGSTLGRKLPTEMRPADIEAFLLARKGGQVASPPTGSTRSAGRWRYVPTPRRTADFVESSALEAPRDQGQPLVGAGGRHRAGPAGISAPELRDP